MLRSGSFLEQFDAFAKPLKDFRIKTLSGALVSIMSSILIVILFISELISFMSPESKQEIIVDTNKGEKMKIYLDLTVYYMPCDLLKLDAIDTTGEQQLNIEHEIFKTQVSTDGSRLSDSIRHTVNDIAAPSKTTKKNDPKYCGSCYGAESPSRRCCNTCEDVQSAYLEKRWIFSNLSSFEQCRDEGMQMAREKLNKEGCRIHGTLKVNRVAGSFHIAPGHSYTEEHVHIHNIQQLGLVQFNMTHIIHTLRFGDMYPGQINSLDGRKMNVEELSPMVSYYLKLVPTVYYSLDNKIGFLATNQYSATWHSKSTPLSGGSSGLPGLFFSYEIAPLLVRIIEEKKPFLHFLTNTCAIVGGVFTVAGLLDAFIYQSSCAVRKHFSARSH